MQSAAATAGGEGGGDFGVCWPVGVSVVVESDGGLSNWRVATAATVAGCAATGWEAPGGKWAHQAKTATAAGRTGRRRAVPKMTLGCQCGDEGISKLVWVSSAGV